MQAIRRAEDRRLAEAGTGGQLDMLLGGPASGTWKLHVYDTQDSGITGDSTLKSARLTRKRSGRAPELKPKAVPSASR